MVDTFFCHSGDELHEEDEVLHPKLGSVLAHRLVGIGGKKVGPAHRHRIQRAVGEFDRHPVLSPELLRDHETEGLSPEGVEGMGDANLSLINWMTCI